MNDSSIIYAFIATVAGCLISVSAALIAAFRRRKSKALQHSASTKPQDVLVPSHYIFLDALSAAHIKQVSAQQFEYNSTSFFQFEIPPVIERDQKPIPRFVPVPIENKRDRIYQRLTPCMAA